MPALRQEMVDTRVKLAWNISVALTIAGIVAFAASFVPAVSPAIGVIGLLLIVAGVIKIIIVRIWVAFFASEPYTAPPESGTRRSSKPSSRS